LWLLFHSWEFATGRRFVADILVNVAIYVPLGMFGYLAFRRFRYLGPVALGAVVSGCVEMIQLYTPGRQCSTVDLATNIAGSIVGVLAGVLFERMSGPVRLELFGGRDRAALALLFCWVAAMLFPLFPDTSLPDWGRKFLAFAEGPWLSPVPLLSAAASWLAVGMMLRSGAGLAATLLLIPAQLFIVTRQPLPVQMVGAVVGILALPLVRRMAPAFPAWAFVAVLLIRGLAPFHPGAHAQPFGWIPFGGFLDSEWQYAIQVFLEKLFYYGTAIWLLRHAGLRWGMAIGSVCVVLACIEVAQIHLPGRTPEITDPILGLLAGFSLSAFGRPRAIGYHANS
jgi:VanZ family protein